MNKQPNECSKDRVNKRVPTIQDLYPNLSPEELTEAEQNLDRYLNVVIGIFERLERGKE